MTGDAPPREQRQPRVDGSMSLLVDMTGAALDPSYAAAAARRGGRPRRRAPLALLVSLVLAGLATGVAGAQARARADDLADSRRALVQDVQERTALTDRLAARSESLAEHVRRARAAALSADAVGRALAADVERLELVAGTVPVTGPGIRVSLQDAARQDGSDGRGGQASEGRIFDRDLQEVVNALWAAGAEAVAVNGLRVSGSTAIRSAGEAVLVDLRPLSPPYVLAALGEAGALETAFAESATARKLQTWTSLYGIGFEVARAEKLRLPAAAAPALRAARPGRTTP